MSEEYYPWGGDFTAVDAKASVAVVILNIDFIPNATIALYGRLKTENIGIEKTIANVISNPHIRYVVLCGNDIRGHRSGKSLLCLYQNGINENHRIIDAPGAIPFIENLTEEAINRFRDQVEVIDLIGETNIDRIQQEIKEYSLKVVDSFGEPYIAIKLKKNAQEDITDKRALHSKIIIDYKGKVTKRE